MKNDLLDGFIQNIWAQGNKYTVAAGYNWLLRNTEHVPWCSWVWNRSNVPNHSFICWLTAQQKLKTRDRLVKFGICTKTSFLFCDGDFETSFMKRASIPKLDSRGNKRLSNRMLLPKNTTLKPSQIKDSFELEKT